MAAADEHVATLTAQVERTEEGVAALRQALELLRSAYR